jgi:PKD repeat protein
VGEIDITSTSTGPVGSYQYIDFGDGQNVPTSNGATESHTYTMNGVYNACITVMFMDSLTGNVCSDTYCDSIVISGVPASQCVAGYTSVQGAGAGEIDFTNISSGPAVGAWYSIDFGDGTSSIISSGATETHTYAMNGTYMACITVIANDSSCVDTYCDTITATGLSGCSAGFSSWQAIDSTGNGGTIVWVTDLSYSQSGNALTYLWDFGDGTTSTNPYPTHVYASTGTYTLCVTIDDGAGCSDTYCDDIVVPIKAIGFTLNIIPSGASASVEEPELLTGLSLYPNPTNSNTTLNVSSAEASDVQISIVSVTGQIVSQELHQLNTGSNQLKLNTEGLMKGYYFLKIISNNQELEAIQFVKN